MYCVIYDIKRDNVKTAKLSRVHAICMEADNWINTWFLSGCRNIPCPCKLNVYVIRSEMVTTSEVSNSGHDVLRQYTDDIASVAARSLCVNNYITKSST
jgi:hypothetical protein